MPQYRISDLNRAGGVTAAVKTEAPDDRAAIAYAAVWSASGLFEVWQPGRLVWPAALQPLVDFRDG